MALGRFATFQTRAAQQLAQDRHKTQIRTPAVRNLKTRNEHDATQQPRQHPATRLARTRRPHEFEQRTRIGRQRQHRGAGDFGSDLLFDQEQHTAKSLGFQLGNDRRSVLSRIDDECLDVGAQRRFERGAVVQIDLQEIHQATAQSLRLLRQDVLGPLIEALELCFHGRQRLPAAIELRPLSPQLGFVLRQLCSGRIRSLEVQESPRFALLQNALARLHVPQFGAEGVPLRTQSLGLRRNRDLALAELATTRARRRDLCLLVDG